MTPSRTRRLRGLALVTRSHDGSTIVDWLSSKTSELFHEKPFFDHAAIIPPWISFLPPGRKWFFCRFILLIRQQLFSPPPSFLPFQEESSVPSSLIYYWLWNLIEKRKSEYKLNRKALESAYNWRGKNGIIFIKRNEIISIQIYLRNYLRNRGCSTIKYKYKHEK